MEFAVSLSKELPTDLVVDYATEDVSARADDGDYEAAEGELRIDAGDTVGTISIQTLVDDIADDHETFRVRLSDARTASSVYGFSDGIATGSIADSSAIGAELRSVPAQHNGVGSTFRFDCI